MVDLDKMKRKRRGSGVTVTKNPKKRTKAIRVSCEYDGDDVVGIKFDSVEHATNKSVLVIKDDEKIWFPFSQIRDFDADDGVLLCSKYIAREKGIDPDW